MESLGRNPKSTRLQLSIFPLAACFNSFISACEMGINSSQKSAKVRIRCCPGCAVSDVILPNVFPRLTVARTSPLSSTKLVTLIVSLCVWNRLREKRFCGLDQHHNRKQLFPAQQNIHAWLYVQVGLRINLGSAWFLCKLYKLEPIHHDCGIFCLIVKTIQVFLITKEPPLSPVWQTHR